MAGLPIDLQLFAMNLFSEKYFTCRSRFRGVACTTGQVGAPRTYGLRLKYR